MPAASEVAAVEVESAADAVLSAVEAAVEEALLPQPANRPRAMAEARLKERVFFAFMVVFLLKKTS